MHNSDAVPILDGALDNPCFVNYVVPRLFYSEIQMYKNVGCESKHVCFYSCSLGGKNVAQLTGNVLFMVASQREVSVRVQEGGFMVDSLLR